MRFSDKQSDQSGQHGMEYVILLTLIMAGIIISGPYVIRSWNAQMKGWEDSTIDSLRDPLLTADDDLITVAGCDATDTYSQRGCARAGLSITDFCQPTQFFSCPSDQQMMMERNYDPFRCQCTIPNISMSDYFDCQYITGNEQADNIYNPEDQNTGYDCCSIWDFDDDTALSDPPPASRCGINADPDCPDGTYRRNRPCDGGYNDSMCDAANICNFSCLEPPYTTGGENTDTWCVDSSGIPDNERLPADTQVQLVEHGSGCRDSVKCEFQCDEGMIVEGAGADQRCAPAPTCGFCEGTAMGGTASCGPEGQDARCPGAFEDTQENRDLCEALGCGWDPMPTVGESYCDTNDLGNPCVSFLAENLCRAGGCTWDPGTGGSTECSTYNDSQEDCTAAGCTYTLMDDLPTIGYGCTRDSDCDPGLYCSTQGSIWHCMDGGLVDSSHFTQAECANVCPSPSVNCRPTDGICLKEGYECLYNGDCASNVCNRAQPGSYCYQHEYERCFCTSGTESIMGCAYTDVDNWTSLSCSSECPMSYQLYCSFDTTEQAKPYSDVVCSTDNHGQCIECWRDANNNRIREIDEMLMDGHNAVDTFAPIVSGFGQGLWTDCSRSFEYCLYNNQTNGYENCPTGYHKTYDCRAKNKRGYCDCPANAPPPAPSPEPSETPPCGECCVYDEGSDLCVRTYSGECKSFEGVCLQP